MATLGQKPATQHVSLQKQTITGNGGTSYTLQQSVGSALDVAVFVNNTRQEPAIAYSASGTTLTMTGAVNSSDHFYVIFLGKAITTTGLPTDGVGTANINANAVTDAKIAGMAASKLTGAMPALDGSALTGISNTGLVRFSGFKVANQTLSRGVITKITGFTGNEIDTHSAFDGTTFTVPSGQAGTYFISAEAEISFAAVGGDGEGYKTYVYKNGAVAASGRYNHNSNQGYTYYANLTVSTLFVLSVGDTIEIYVEGGDQSGGGGGRITGATSGTEATCSRFFGFRLA